MISSMLSLSLLTRNIYIDTHSLNGKGSWVGLTGDSILSLSSNPELTVLMWKFKENPMCTHWSTWINKCSWTFAGWPKPWNTHWASSFSMPLNGHLQRQTWSYIVTHHWLALVFNALTSTLLTMRTSHISLQCVRSFFYEALCILSALTWAHKSTYSPHRLLIYTDSMNTI